MSIPNQPPIDPSKSDSLSGKLDLQEQNSAVFQRAVDMSEVDSRTNLNKERVVTVQFNSSTKRKIDSLCHVLGTSTDDLLMSSLQYIICYSQTKNIELKKMKGYSEMEANNNNDSFEQEIELGIEIFQELTKQNLLSDVSKCLVLGLGLLYLRLIELDKIG
jgi:hypothetical protein